MLFETDGGVLADVEAFVNTRYGSDIRCEVVGESGTLSLPRPATMAQRFQERCADAYRHELESRIAVAGAGAWDGYAAAAISAACLDSLETGAPVEVALDAAL